VTILEQDDVKQTTDETATEVVEPRTHRFRSARPTGLAHLATVVVAIAVSLFVLWLVCADPITHVWYQSRQHGLRNQAAAALTKLGSEKAKHGDAVGVLESSTGSINVVIAQGSDAATLHGAPGHVTSTPLPGARGNSVVVGHAKDWGAPFKALAKLTVGSTLYLQAHPGVYKLPETGDFVYTVRSVTRTSASDLRYLAPSTDYRLTLVTDTESRLRGNQVLVVTAVSGTVGHLRSVPQDGSLEPSSGVPGSALLDLVLGVVVIGLAFAYLSRGHRRGIVVVALVPVGAFAVLAAFLTFDQLFFRALA
jgi:LPXTG-site transpeptidase (sortase) family protein